MTYFDEDGVPNTASYEEENIHADTSDDEFFIQPSNSRNHTGDYISRGFVQPKD